METLTVIEQLQSLKNFVEAPHPSEIIENAITHLESLQVEVDRLQEQVWAPDDVNFAESVIREASRQTHKWAINLGPEKHPTEYVYLLGFIASKAAQCAMTGSNPQAQKHIVEVAAVCANWHSRLNAREDALCKANDSH